MMNVKRVIVRPPQHAHVYKEKYTEICPLTKDRPYIVSV